MKNNKKEPWRITVGIISIFFISYMWVQKDIINIYAAIPKEDAIPLIITTIIVSSIKVVVITGGILFVKWIVAKFKK